MGAFRIIGIAMIFLGMALVLNSGIFLAGLAIADAGTSDFAYVIRGGGFLGGIFLLIGGILLVEARKNKRN